MRMAGSKGANSKALFTAGIVLVCGLALVVVINGLLNLISGDPFFVRPGIIGIVLMIALPVSAAVNAYRNVAAGKPWYNGKS